MPSQERFRKFKPKLDALSDQHGVTGNGYYKVARQVDGRRCIYTIPLVKGRYVKPRHIKLARERLHITDTEWKNA